METENLDKLYLEISQITKAKTKTDLENETKILRLESRLNSYKQKLTEVRNSLATINEDITNVGTRNFLHKIVQGMSDFLGNTKNGRPETPWSDT